MKSNKTKLFSLHFLFAWIFVYIFIIILLVNDQYDDQVFESEDKSIENGNLFD